MFTNYSITYTQTYAQTITMTISHITYATGKESRTQQSSCILAHTNTFMHEHMQMIAQVKKGLAG